MLLLSSQEEELSATLRIVTENQAIANAVALRQNTAFVPCRHTGHPKNDTPEADTLFYLPQGFPCIRSSAE